MNACENLCLLNMHLAISSIMHSDH